MEIMGLAVIVILLALGMFFLTRFSLFEETTSEASLSQQKQLASNFVNTLLHAEAGCIGSSATFTKLIDDIETPDLSLLQCGDGTLSEYLEFSVSTILEKTLNTWGQNYDSYEFIVKFPISAGVEDIVISHNCTSVQSEPSTYYIPGDLGDILVTLKICY